MGKVFSSVKHPFKNFNLESRAHKVISQHKPTVAPRHRRDQIEYERILKEFPQELEESLKKNPLLDKNLKNVFVVSRDSDKVGHKQEENPERPLPTDKSQSQSFLYGMKEPDNVPIGKTTLGNALEFITRYQEDPKNYNAKRIAEKYFLAEDTVRNILKFFKVFEVYIPLERQTKATFAGPSLPKITVLKQLRKELPAPKDPKENA